MILLFPPAESAQAVYDRLRARLSSVAWVEFTDYSFAETNYWTEYRIERPHAVASTHHTVFSVSETDGIRTTDNETRKNRPARPWDLRVPPGWESLVGERGEPSGDARETPQGTEIDLRVGVQRYVLRVDRSTGLPKGYILVNEGSVPHDLLEFGYGKVVVHGTPPNPPIHVAEPKPLREIVAPFAAWLRHRSIFRLALIYHPEWGEDRETAEIDRTHRARNGQIVLFGGLVPGFEPFFGTASPASQTVGIRWIDALREGYVVRRYRKEGWTDVYYGTHPQGGFNFPVGYERYVDGKRVERVGIEIAP